MALIQVSEILQYTQIHGFLKSTFTPKINRLKVNLPAPWRIWECQQRNWSMLKGICFWSSKNASGVCFLPQPPPGQEKTQTCHTSQPHSCHPFIVDFLSFKPPFI